jgi:hypothetical protein
MQKPSTTSVRVTFSRGESLYDHYFERATKRGKRVEDEIVERLASCQQHTSTQALYIADDDLNVLSQIAGKTIRTVDDLLTWARSVSSMNVSGTQIDLSERLLKRLDTRRFGLTMPEMLNKTVTECLEERVGLR